MGKPMDTILYIIAGPLFLVSITAHFYVKLGRLLPRIRRPAAGLCQICKMVAHHVRRRRRRRPADVCRRGSLTRISHSPPATIAYLMPSGWTYLDRRLRRISIRLQPHSLRQIQDLSQSTRFRYEVCEKSGLTSKGPSFREILNVSEPAFFLCFQLRNEGDKFLSSRNSHA